MKCKLDSCDQSKKAEQPQPQLYIIFKKQRKFIAQRRITPKNKSTNTTFPILKL